MNDVTAAFVLATGVPCLCVWMLAHALRDASRIMDRSLDLAEDLAEQNGELRERIAAMEDGEGWKQ